MKRQFTHMATTFAFLWYPIPFVDELILLKEEGLRCSIGVKPNQSSMTMASSWYKRGIGEIKPFPT